MSTDQNWKEEKRSAYIYHILSQIESNPIHQKLFKDLSLMAERQAAIWEQQLKASKITVPATYSPDWQTKLILAVVKRLGARSSRALLAAMKIRGMSIYQIPEADASPLMIHNHAERQHMGMTTSNNLRAAVFGINDGLLSNASLMLGIVGAHASYHYIVLAGIAGLLAGASSMGAGEYVSVRSQREMLEYQMALEKEELELYPAEETQELTLIYQARGLSKDQAETMAKTLIQQPDKALNILAREELGINPDELSSPWGAALSSFFSFGVGGLIPLAPFLITKSPSVVVWTVLLTGFSLFSVGALISVFTQRPLLWGGLRMLLIGTIAGTLTYFIGHLLGVNI